MTINRRALEPGEPAVPVTSTDAGRALGFPGVFEPFRLHDSEISGLAWQAGSETAIG